MAVYRVPWTLNYAGGGAPGVNVWHVRTVSVYSNGSADLLAMLNAIHTFYTAIKSVYPTGTSIALGQVIQLDDQREIPETMPTVTGTGGTSLAPTGLAITVGWRTSLAARRGRGRTFIGPLQLAAVQTDGTIDNNIRSLVQSAANSLASTSQGAANGAVGVYGLEEKAPAGTEDYSVLPRVLRDITGAVIHDKFAHLRSRRD